MERRRSASPRNLSDKPVSDDGPAEKQGVRGVSDHELFVPREGSGERLDAFLARRLPDRSRSLLKKLIVGGRVLVNGQVVKPGYDTREGDVILVWVEPETVNTEIVPQPMDLGILFEDADILVINKPPGLVVHPGAGHREGTLVHGLLAHCSRLASQGAPLRPGIVHRLDQGTSGAMVVAKTDRAYLNLIEQFKMHRVTKEYVALVYGVLRDPQGEIRVNLDRHPVDRKRMAVVDGKGREAISRWRIERDWGEVSLVQVVIETGRTHQIRVHMSHLQHPIVGDSTYGGGRRRAFALASRPLQELVLQARRPMLHSRCLGFLHPVHGAPVRFLAPLPEDFSLLLDRLARLSES